MLKLFPLFTAVLLSTAVSEGIPTPNQLSSHSWSSSGGSGSISTNSPTLWYSWKTSIPSLMIEASTTAVVARQILPSTSTAASSISKVWDDINGNSYRMVRNNDAQEEEGSSSVLPSVFRLWSFDSPTSRTVLNIKTLGGTATSPLFTDRNYTLPQPTSTGSAAAASSQWYGLTSLDNVVYFYDKNNGGNHLIGINVATGSLVTDILLKSSQGPSSAAGSDGGGANQDSTEIESSSSSASSGERHNAPPPMSIFDGAKVTCRKYPDGKKLMSLKMKVEEEGSSAAANTGRYHHVVVDLVGNRVVSTCDAQKLTSAEDKFLGAYGTFMPSYNDSSSSSSSSSAKIVHPLMFVWGSIISSNGVGLSLATMFDASESSCQPVWRRSTSTTGIPAIRMEGDRTFIRDAPPFTFLPSQGNDAHQTTTIAVYTSYEESTSSGRLVWLDFSTGLVQKNIVVDSSISRPRRAGCSAISVGGPALISASMQEEEEGEGLHSTDDEKALLLSFNLILYQYSLSGERSWTFDYDKVFPSSSATNSAGCASWRYYKQDNITYFVSNPSSSRSGSTNSAAGLFVMDNRDPSTPSPASTLAPVTFVPGSPTGEYSPYYRVSLSDGKVGQAAEIRIWFIFLQKFGVNTSHLTNFSWANEYVAFRVYGSSDEASTVAAKNALYLAVSNATVRAELGFATVSTVAGPISTSAPTGTPSPTSPNNNGNLYSTWFKVSLANYATKSTAQRQITNALIFKYSISSDALTGWYFSGDFTYFQLYYGGTAAGSSSSGRLAISNAVSGLSQAGSNATLRAELGFASCEETVNPNAAASIGAAFGTLFIVLIAIGVAVLICVVAIVVCCCCCTAKAVANAASDDQAVLNVTGNENVYVQMNSVSGQPSNQV